MRISGLSKSKATAEKYESKPTIAYNPAADSTISASIPAPEEKGKKRKAEDDGEKSMFGCVIFCVVRALRGDVRVGAWLGARLRVGFGVGFLPSSK